MEASTKQRVRREADAHSAEIRRIRISVRATEERLKSMEELNEKLTKDLTLINDTIKSISKNKEIISEDRDKIVSVQTPQGFQLKEIISLHKESKEKFTDDISLALEKKIKIKLILEF